MREKSPLAKFIDSRDFELAKAFIERQRGNVDYSYGEGMVFTVMRCEESPQDLIDTVLDVFLGTRQNYPRAHGSWVHSLSHFTEYLWQKGQFEWIKKFNEVAFKGALELKNTNCCDRLVIDFGRYAEWYHDPAEFYLTIDNLTWMNWPTSPQRLVAITTLMPPGADRHYSRTRINTCLKGSNGPTR